MIAASATEALTLGWLLVASVDLVRGEIVDRCFAPERTAVDDEVVLAAIEMLRSRERPRQVFLLAEKEVHFYTRLTENPQLALVMVADRATNLGLLLAGFRELQKAIEL